MFRAGFFIPMNRGSEGFEVASVIFDAANTSGTTITGTGTAPVNATLSAPQTPVARKGQQAFLAASTGAFNLAFMDSAVTTVMAFEVPQVAGSNYSIIIDGQSNFAARFSSSVSTRADPNSTVFTGATSSGNLFQKYAVPGDLIVYGMTTEPGAGNSTLMVRNLTQGWVETLSGLTWPDSGAFDEDMYLFRPYTFWAGSRAFDSWFYRVSFWSRSMTEEELEQALTIEEARYTP